MWLQEFPCLVCYIMSAMCVFHQAPFLIKADDATKHYLVTTLSSVLYQTFQEFDELIGIHTAFIDLESHFSLVGDR